MKSYEIVIIGGGAAGLAAAIKATELGCKTLVIDRENQLGGVLNQCIHQGYGLSFFKEDITGCEYAQRLIDRFNSLKIEHELDALVFDINDDRVIRYISPRGIHEVKAGALIFAAGCREIPKVSLDMPGSRLAGVFTSGSIQNLVNIYGYLPGKEIAVYGTNKLSLLTASRLALEGANIKAVIEEHENIKGTKEAIEQCRKDFDMRFITSHVIKAISGVDRIEGITIAKVDEFGKLIEGTEEDITCDTLMLSVDLKADDAVLRNALKISEEDNLLIDEKMQTKREWIFACGDVIGLHSSVDEVTLEGYAAGEAAVRYVLKIH